MAKNRFVFARFSWFKALLGQLDGFVEVF